MIARRVLLFFFSSPSAMFVMRPFAYCTCPLSSAAPSHSILTRPGLKVLPCALCFLFKYAIL